MSGFPKIPGSGTAGSVNFEQKFIDLAEHIDTFLSIHARKYPSIYRDLIPKGQLTPYEGLVRKSNIFHPGLGSQAGLQSWKPIQVSRAPSGGDPGHNACLPPPAQTFTSAIESRHFTGIQTAWASEPICVNDIRFIEEGKNQAMMHMSMMSMVTDSVWETLNRETYVDLSGIAGRQYVISDTQIEIADSPSVRFFYDPYVVDSDGNNYLLYPVGVQPGALDWSYFNLWQDYLGDQAPEGAVANQDGEAMFMAHMHKRDVARMIRNDPKLRETFNYGDPMKLLNGYGSFKSFDGWVLGHDQRQMRFQPTGVVVNPGIYGKYQLPAGNYIKAVRVLPMRLGRAITIGNIPEANPEYQFAELAVGTVFMNNVVQNLIAPNVTNLGSGMVFGAAPGSNGMFTWVNEYDKVENPLRRNGFFYALWEIFQKPLAMAREATTFLYRRCPQVKAGTCQVDATYPAANTAASPVANVAAEDISGNNLTVLLDDILACSQVGSVLTVTLTVGGAGTTPTTAYILDASAAPTYLIGFPGTPVASDLETDAVFTCA